MYRTLHTYIRKIKGTRSQHLLVFYNVTLFTFNHFAPKMLPHMAERVVNTKDDERVSVKKSC